MSERYHLLPVLPLLPCVTTPLLYTPRNSGNAVTAVVTSERSGEHPAHPPALLAEFGFQRAGVQA